MQSYSIAIATAEGASAPSLLLEKDMGIERVPFEDVMRELRLKFPRNMVPIFIEMRLFRLADAHLEGYAGGAWEAAKLGDVSFFVPPGDQAKSVKLICPGSQRTVETDLVTAGAAITLTAINHLSFMYAERVQQGDPEAEEVTQQLVDMFYMLRDVVIDEDSPLDTSSLLFYID